MESMKCNCCGKEIKEEQGIQKEDVLEIVKDWGYFSGKDMEIAGICDDFTIILTKKVDALKKITMNFVKLIK